MSVAHVPLSVSWVSSVVLLAACLFMWTGHRWLASAFAVPSIAAVLAQFFLSASRTDRSQAHQHGAQAVEFDLEFTKDDVPILFHDADVDRTTDGTGPIGNLTWAQVSKLNAAAKFKDGKAFPHTPIPTLDETVELCIAKKLKIFFDVKAPDHRAVAVLTKLYKKHPWLYDNAAVCSFYPWLVYQVKRADSKIITAHTWRRWCVSYADIESTKPRQTNPFKYYLTVALDIFNVWSIHSWLPGFTGADLVLTNRLDISAAYVDDMRAKGLDVVVWTVNDPNEQLWMRHSLNVVYLTDRTSTTPMVEKAAHMLKELADKK